MLLQNRLEAVTGFQQSVSMYLNQTYGCACSNRSQAHMPHLVIGYFSKAIASIQAA